MTCYEELKARGLIAQVTNEEEISKMINEGKAVFYIGFDPTICLKIAIVKSRMKKAPL